MEAITESIKLLKEGFDKLVQGMSINRQSIMFADKRIVTLTNVVQDLSERIIDLERRLDIEEAYNREQNENS